MMLTRRTHVNVTIVNHKEKLLNKEIMENEFGIDLQKVITSNAAWSINKMLATKLSIHPYFKIGEIFKSLSDDEIKFIADQTMEADDDVAAELYLMMMLLSIGHELQPESDEMMDQWFDDLCMFITCEAITRAGLAETNYENLVFGGDFMANPFILMKDDGLALIGDVLKEDNV